MSWLGWLGITAILIAVVALTRTGPKGGNPVGGTRLMKSARYVLLIGAIGCAVLGVFGALRH